MPIKEILMTVSTHSKEDRYTTYSYTDTSNKMPNTTSKKSALIVLSLMLLLIYLIFIPACTERLVDEVTVEELDPFVYIGGALKQGETLAQALQAKGLGSSAIHPVVNQLNSIYNLRRSMPQDSFRVKVDSMKVIHQLTYYPLREKIRIFSVNRDSIGFYYPHIDTLDVVKVLRKTEGIIKGSLYSSLREFGEGPHLINKYAEIFQWDVDFLVDTREGDRFSLLYEQYMLGNTFVKYGEILTAEYESRTYHKRAYRFEIDNQHAKYFDKIGESFQKAFLRSPLNYTRISSHFSRGRYHPVLKIVRPHNGVDYAAPTGTPVVASSDGVVTHAAWKGGHPTVNGRSGGYGMTVMIRHPNGYETLYGHLSGYGPGIRKGVRVSQNQVIGYVGSTGLSTGPHLHYTVYHHGTAIDPLKMNNVAGPPVPQNKKGEFKALIERYDFLMDVPNDEVGISKPIPPEERTLVL